MAAQKTKGEKLRGLIFLLPLTALASVLVHAPAGNRSGPPSVCRRPLFPCRGYRKGTHTLALNAAGYTAAGAGTSADNQNFTMSAGNDANGNKYFVYGTGAATRYLYFATAGVWYLGSVLNAATSVPASTDDYSSAAGQISTTFPLSGWARNSYNGGAGATAPAPTFTANTAGEFRILSLRSPRIAPGAAKSFEVSVEADDGWTAPLTMAFSCATSGITGSFAGTFPAALTPETASVIDYYAPVLLISVAAGVAAGVYPFSVTATGGGVSVFGDGDRRGCIRFR